MEKKRFLCWLLCLFMVCAAFNGGSLCLAAPIYNVIDLGTLGGPYSYASSINNNGHIVGYAHNTAGYYRATLFDATGGGNNIDLGTLGGSISRAYDINDSGQVVGYATIPDGRVRAFLYTEGNMFDLGTLSGSQSEGFAINNSGQIVGRDIDVNGKWRAFLYQNGNLVHIQTPNSREVELRAINDKGEMTGYFYDNIHALLYTNGSFKDLGILPGTTSSYGWAINNSGQVVGTTYTYKPGIYIGWDHAFWYRDETLIGLGTLGGRSSSAKSINDYGQIVGYSETSKNETRAFIYNNGTMTNLNTLIPPNSNWTLNIASDINDKGQIVGYGKNPAGQTHGFLLTPTISKFLPAQAILLTEQVIGAPYLLGGKGYDFTAEKFVNSDAVTTAKYWYWNRESGQVELEIGLDCSGLVLWAYSHAFYGEETGSFSRFLRDGPIRYEGADGQYRYNSHPITRSELQPGDILVLDRDKNGTADHVAMYVGSDQVIHAEGVLFNQILQENLDDFLARYKNLFMGYHRLMEATEPDIYIVGKSPIDLIITGPDGRTITKELGEIPGMYYAEYDFDGDGDFDDIVTIPKGQMGDYAIQIIPNWDASETDLYGLEVITDSTVTVLVSNAMIGSLPPKPYIFHSTIPEPGTLTLLGLGALLLVCRKKDESMIN